MVVKRKEISLAILILLSFVGFLWLEKPLTNYLSEVLVSRPNAKFIAGSLVRAIIIVAALIMITRKGLLSFSGLTHWKQVKNLQATGIALVFIVGGISSNWSTYMAVNTETLVTFAFYTLSVGIVEELVFRGIVFPLTITASRQHRKPILTGAIISSLLFGSLHYVNLFKQPDNFIGITSQVFFATAIGVYFCGLLARTSNILVPIIIHMLVNVSFGAGELTATTDAAAVKDATTGINWSSVIPTTIFFSFIFAGGVYMIVQSRGASLLRKLDSGLSHEAIK